MLTSDQQTWFPLWASLGHPVNLFGVNLPKI